MHDCLELRLGNRDEHCRNHCLHVSTKSRTKREANLAFWRIVVKIALFVLHFEAFDLLYFKQFAHFIAGLLKTAHEVCFARDHGVIVAHCRKLS